MSGVPARQLEKTAALTQGNLEDEAEGNRELDPAESERPECDPEDSSGVDIPELPDNRRKANEINKLGGTPKQRRTQIRATLLPGYHVCESGKTRMRILHAGWFLEWTTSRLFITGDGGRPVPRSASGAPPKSSQRS